MTKAKLAAAAGLAVLFVVGISASVSLGTGETTGTNTATAIATACRSGRCNTVTATHTATFTIPTVTLGTTTIEPPPPPPVGAFVSNEFEGSIQTAVEAAPFYTQYTYPYNNGFDSSHFLAISGDNGTQGLGLVIKNTDQAPNTFGPQTFVGVHSSDAHGHQGESTWYRADFKIPTSGYRLNHGCEQVVFEWHEQTTSLNSTSFWLCSWSNDSTGNPDMSKIMLRLTLKGGSTSTPLTEHWYTPVPAQDRPELFNAQGGLIVGQWYHMTVHFVWSTSSTNGAVDCLINGITCPFVLYQNGYNGSGPHWTNSHPFSTLYSVNGTPDFVNYGFYMYAPWPPVDSQLHYDNYAIGPTLASIGG